MTFKYVVFRAFKTYYGFHDLGLDIQESLNNPEHAIGRALNRYTGESLSTVFEVYDCVKGVLIDLTLYRLDEEGFVRRASCEEHILNYEGQYGYDLNGNPTLWNCDEMDTIILARLQQQNPDAELPRYNIDGEPQGRTFIVINPKNKDRGNAEEQS